MDFQNESNGSNISYLLDISMSLSLSDDDVEGNRIAGAECPTIPRAVGQVADFAVPRAERPVIPRTAMGQVVGLAVTRAEHPTITRAYHTFARTAVGQVAHPAVIHVDHPAITLVAVGQVADFAVACAERPKITHAVSQVAHPANPQQLPFKEWWRTRAVV